MATLYRLLASSRFHTFSLIFLISLITWQWGPHLTFNHTMPLADPSHRWAVIGGLWLFWMLSNVFLINNKRMQKVYLNKQQRTLYRFLQEDFNTALKLSQPSLWRRLNKTHHKQWYIVFGLHNSGRTTLLNTIAKDHQGTCQRCCSEFVDYWHFDHAVFVNIKGDQLTDELAMANKIQVFNRLFYDCLRNNIVPAGVLITAQLQELHTKPDLYDHEANIIRHSLDYLTRLFPEVAISIIATKCDLILGFSEFFTNMGPEERDQVCGIQFPPPPYKKDLPSLCDQEFSAILNRFNERVLWQIQQASSAEQRHLIKEFPIQMELLKPYMGHFLNEVLPHINLTLNGIYFTSALQSQTPYNHLTKPAKDVLALQPIHQARKRTENKAFFIRELFNQFIHAPRIEYTPRALHWANYTAAILTVTTIGLGSYVYKNYQHHASNLQVLNQLLDHASHDVNANHYRHILTQLYALQQTYNTLKDNKQQLTPQERTQNTQLMKQAQTSFWMILQHKLYLEMTNAVERELTALTSEDNTNYMALYETLGTFLMLHDSHSMHEPQFIQWFNRHWQAQKLNATERGLLDQYCRLLITRPLPQQKINFPLMLKAQTILKNKSPQDLAIEQLQHDIAQHPVTLIEHNANLVIDPDVNMISNLYTQAQVAHVQERAFDISHTITRHLWTIDEDTLDEKTLAKQVLNQYYQNYAQHWQEVIDKVRYKPQQRFHEYATDLAALSSHYSPIKTLIRTIQNNTRPINGNDDFNQVVSTQFDTIHSLNIDSPTWAFNQAIQGLSDNMNAINRAKNPIAMAYAHARLRVTRHEQNDTFSKMRTAAKTLPEPWQQWSTDLADDGWRMMLNGARAYVNVIWQQFVLPEYQSTIKDRYPVFKKAGQDIALNHFTRFFAGDGIMETFYKNYLSDFVDEEHGWRWKVVDGRHIDIPDSILENFMRSMLIQKMLFSHNNTMPEINFTLKQTALSPTIKEFSLLVDGQTVEYSAKPETQTTITWPGTGESENQMRFVRADDKTTKIDFNDAWGWFRVLDLAEIKPTDSTQKVTAIFKFAGVTIAQFDIETDDIINPFTPEVIEKFRCPEVL